MKYFIIFLCLLVSGFSSTSFSKSKKIMKKIYADNQKTFYCGCNYDLKNKANMIERKECGYTPRNERTKKGKLNRRARRIEWEHVMPAQNFGKHLPCWKQGGRKHCKKVSAKFRKMEADLMNLVPAIGELNGDRSNFRYSALNPKQGQYGQCQFSVNFKERKAFIAPHVRGDVARIYLYMAKTYDIRLSKQEKKMFAIWNKQDPLSAWEKERKKQIHRFQ